MVCNGQWYVSNLLLSLVISGNMGVIGHMGLGRCGGAMVSWWAHKSVSFDL